MNYLLFGGPALRPIRRQMKNEIAFTERKIRQCCFHFTIECEFLVELSRRRGTQ